MQSPNEMRMKVVGKAAEDADFRAKLLNDPKAAIEQELGVTIPASMSIEIHQEHDATAHLVLPPGSKLNEGDLRAVAGGAPRRLAELQHQRPGGLESGELVIPFGG